MEKYYPLVLDYLEVIAQHLPTVTSQQVRVLESTPAQTCHMRDWVRRLLSRRDIRDMEHRR